ncbi:MAG: hypothetical protein IJ767_03390 [Bacteroidaceae bacterium]|nr:hypothetical protein [Bacteroidaceae bacterium]MBR1800522.1 hypothetical protein [Bacteroidaceae bacterium]
MKEKSKPACMQKTCERPRQKSSDAGGGRRVVEGWFYTHYSRKKTAKMCLAVDFQILAVPVSFLYHIFAPEGIDFEPKTGKE